MLYCPPNITLSQVWLHPGLSPCFTETVASCVISGLVLLLGGWRLRLYRRYGTLVESALLPKSKLFVIQILLMLFLPVLAITRFGLQATVINDGCIYGYMILNCVSAVVTYGFALRLLMDERNYLLPSVPPYGHSLTLLLFWSLTFVKENIVFVDIHKLDSWFDFANLSEKIELVLFGLRYTGCFALFILGFCAPGVLSPSSYSQLHSHNDLRISMGNDTTSQGSTFRNFWSKLKKLFPFLWPKKSILLELRVIFCLLLLAGGRIINLYVPIYSKLIVDSMADEPVVFRWDYILTYVAFKFLQGGGTGGMGLLNNLRSFLWIRVQQYTTREIEVELFRHLHSLSLRWHLGRKTGEVLRVMDRGTDSIDNLLNYILFSILPTIVDIIIAVVFFISAFNSWFGLIVFTTMILYIVSTVFVTEWRTKFQRSMNLADNAQKARSVDSLLNFETVKYYGAESYEVECFKKAILHYQGEEWKSLITLNILNTLQNIIICGGLLAGSLLCVHMVVAKQGLTVGDYVLFASYIIQLYVPLNWFGTYYRAIQKNFVDMENMFDLLQEDQEVFDAPGAKPLEVVKGEIKFVNVSFSYIPEKTVLKNISFEIPPGHTVALVGPSGSGKSTIVRLLFRFYDVHEGGVYIDNTNIKTVTQSSLREAIGVVPQDTVLFNNTIRFNIQYGRVGANDADIITAAKAADIHERILSFPDGYETQVGERGLKLSGGEKQRVAIARTVLKSPPIVLLDEATSALDTQTERNIQAALSRVCASRTTLIVAHRLSTIIHANQILVLKDGEIIERGSHEELLAFDGVYKDMWDQQLKKENIGESDSIPVLNGTS
ncbi:ATP-binding cassette sub-family B member 6 [Schistocerca cancellata]|uniref:ATP-binding cassette sub-family B member 6 n=1 Tax=Schistocerca cancellata TaxID=274614 RepID=UPI0021180A70|nr:ATP-binding cassette sub-family B member 6 [Schistocerca cancellata]XP_049781770.1 ATP-binding cassette sub-family B member 6 [Schistocerca cancellata]XP_049781771.1 ATP-binding cassette sub-family B member 6 [Schistocerca cancellata]XP_049781772.1 ATP-binding cassette sub-family B member 6 [Schistocerca cancellata]